MMLLSIERSDEPSLAHAIGLAIQKYKKRMTNTTRILQTVNNATPRLFELLVAPTQRSCLSSP